MTLSLFTFIWSSFIRALPRVFLLTVSNAGHSQSMCADVSFSVPHFQYDGDFTLPVLRSMYLGTGTPCKAPHQHPAMFPIRFINIFDISIGRSFQPTLTGHIFFTGFPFYLSANLQFTII